MNIKRPAIVLAISLFLFFQGLSAMAHGGGDLVAGPVQAGPYIVSVWVNPPQPRTEEPLHFTVGVAQPENKAAILDAQVLVTMQLLQGDLAPLSAPATTDQSINKLFYETDLHLLEPGRYLTTIEIAGSMGQGDLSLELDVIPPSPFNWFLIGLAGMGLVLVLGWLRTRRNREDGIEN
jgi:hypothetical protein